MQHHHQDDPAPSELAHTLRAGITGAAVAGTWAAVNEAIRVRDKEATMNEAVIATASSAAVGAAAGVVAHVATHVARSVPLLGLAALAAGALYLSQSDKAAASDEAPAGDAPLAD